MRIPTSCYRLQLSPAFTLDAARAVAPYLRSLGVGDVYLSPILAARPGSTHGYDVVDPSRVSPELGGAEALERLAGELQRLDMGLVVDIVPNHMAADHRNPWWWDVLRLGRGSPHARAFDIEWDAPGAGGRLVLPVLGAPPAAAIERGELRIVDEDGELRIAYYEHRFPIDPETGVAAGDGLSALLAAQRYRLEDWRTGVPNYRRFFDIADLPAVAVEHEDVFAAMHAEVLRLVREGTITGLRVDHIDGLRDPQQYLERLRAATGGAYVVVEKILARDERLPQAWAAAGTSGYDFLAIAGGLFVDPGGAARLHAAHRRVTGLPERFGDIAAAAKRAALADLLAPDLDRVARLGLVSAATSDVEALRALTVSLDVYRTYVDAAGASPADRDRLAAAAARAEAGTTGALADAIAQPTTETLPVVLSWQQLTGPVAAKGVEDTALYVDTALLARNEPGCAPDWPFTDAAEFHRRCGEHAGRHPLNATSTHDTKRSEDVRMRISALSELGGEWESAFARWHDLNTPLRARPDAAPNANEEWLLYQTLVGAWPIDADRICAYMTKAVREAKVHTSWIAPDESYEADLRRFATDALASTNAAFLADLDRLAGRCAAIGSRSSLALLVLKLAAPGVPDVYWGNEDWDLSLVDPDNRRPVDFAARAGGRAADSPKLLVTRAGLELRRRERELFVYGSYVPIEAAGRHADRVLAFARVHASRWVIAAVARLTAGLDGWGDTRLVLPAGAPERWHDVLTGTAVTDPSATTLFASLPAALLVAK
jgi:malto-oligosyltrehalose synthase